MYSFATTLVLQSRSERRFCYNKLDFAATELPLSLAGARFVAGLQLPAGAVVLKKKKKKLDFNVLSTTQGHLRTVKLRSQTNTCF